MLLLSDIKVVFVNVFPPPSRCHSLAVTYPRSFDADFFAPIIIIIMSSSSVVVVVRVRVVVYVVVVFFVVIPTDTKTETLIETPNKQTLNLQTLNNTKKKEKKERKNMKPSTGKTCVLGSY